MTIYVLPSEEGQPPRAILALAMVQTEDGMAAINPVQATWSRDAGCWMVNEVPIEQELGDAITNHAKSLGVVWD